MSTPVPRKIGKYELEKHLGGGMSAVYRSRDTLIGRTVAVKILKEAYRPDDPVAQRFMLEAQIAGNLNHDHVIRTYDFGFDSEGRPYMVLEFLEGEDLSQAIKGVRTGSLANQARIGAELAAALEYVHPRDIIHRDLKPANVFLSGPAGTVKLMDFGIARTGNVSITQAGMTLGTPGYMAPEQVRGETLTKAADIYAYGVVLWELFTGARAFSGDTLDRVFYMVLNEPLDLGRLRARGVPEELSQQIGKCTAKEAWKRPEDLRAIRQELLRLADPLQSAVIPALSQVETVAMPVVKEAGPTPPPPATPPARKNNRTLIIAGAGAVAGMAVVAAILLSGGAKDAAKSTATTRAGRIETPTGTMMLVPDTPFLFGAAKEPVTIPAFYVDRTEVTNKAFAEYARATSAPLPGGNPDLPVVNVTLEEAQAFAQWAGKRIPTMKQWEKAARGLDGRTYPWGEAPAADRANVGSGRLVPVTEFPGGASPFQALQMVGNAWEWVDETAAPSAERMAQFASVLSPPLAAGERWVRIRGGSFKEKLDPAVMWEGAVMPARFRSPLIGFRCVKAAE